MGDHRGVLSSPPRVTALPPHALTSAVLFSTRALNSVLLPTLGRPTMPVLSAMLVTAVPRNPRALAGAAVVHPTVRPAMKPLLRAPRRVAERATSREHVLNAMADDMIARCVVRAKGNKERRWMMWSWQNVIIFCLSSIFDICSG
jgi:hypothetical protein